MTRHIGAEDESCDRQWRRCVTCRNWLHISEFPVHDAQGNHRRHCGQCWKARVQARRVDDREQRNERKRIWYRENRSYVSAQSAAWRKAHWDEYLIYHRGYMSVYRPANRDRINAWNRTYYQANKEYINAQRRKRYAELRAV